MGSSSPLTARVEKHHGIARIALAGELDMATAPLLNEHLADLERDEARAIMLDLRELDFIDSTGLHAFLQARQRASLNGHRFILIGAGPAALRLFELTGTQYLLDEQEAVTLLDQFTGGSYLAPLTIVTADDVRA